MMINSNNSSCYSNNNYPENRDYVNWRDIVLALLPATISSRLLPTIPHSCAISVGKKIGSCLHSSSQMRKWILVNIYVNEC